MTDAAASEAFPLALVDVDMPRAADVYGYPLLVVRPDGHVAWRGDTTIVRPGEMIARLRGEGNCAEAGAAAAA